MRKAVSDLKYTSLKCLSSGLQYTYENNLKTIFDCLCPPDVTEEEEGDEGKPDHGHGQGDQGAWPGGGGPGGPLGQQAAHQVTDVEHQEAADWHKIPEQGTIMGVIWCHKCLASARWGRCLLSGPGCDSWGTLRGWRGNLETQPGWMSRCFWGQFWNPHWTDSPSGQVQLQPSRMCRTPAWRRRRKEWGLWGGKQWQNWMRREQHLSHCPQWPALTLKWQRQLSLRWLVLNGIFFSIFNQWHNLPKASELMYLSGNLPIREANAPWKIESFELKMRAEASVR